MTGELQKVTSNSTNGNSNNIKELTLQQFNECKKLSKILEDKGRDEFLVYLSQLTSDTNEQQRFKQEVLLIVLNKPALVSQLLEMDLDLNYRIDDCTALEMAVFSNCPTTVALLRSHGAQFNNIAKQYAYDNDMRLFSSEVDLNIVDPDGSTVLDFAIACKAKQITEKLLTDFPLLAKVKYQNGLSVAHSAAKYDVGILNLVLNYNPELLNEADNEGETLIETAILYHQQDCVDLLIQKGANLEAKAPGDDNLLHVSLSQPNDGISKSLIKVKPSLLFEPNAEGLNPIAIIILDEKIGLLQFVFREIPVDYFIKNYFKDNLPNLITTTNRIDEVDLLLKKQTISLEEELEFKLMMLRLEEPIEGKGKNYYITFKKTPLHYAAMTNNTDIVDLILKYEPRFLNLKDNNDYTPLHIALLRDNFNVASHLLTYAHCDIKETDKYGRNALHLAAIKSIDLVSKLIELSPELAHSQDIHGFTPPMLSIRYGHIDITGFFIGKKLISTSLVNEEGENPLHLSAASGIYELASSVLAYNPKWLTAKDHKEHTPLSDARDNKEIMELFLNSLTKRTDKIIENIFYNFKLENEIFKLLIMKIETNTNQLDCLAYSIGNDNVFYIDKYYQDLITMFEFIDNLFHEFKYKYNVTPLTYAIENGAHQGIEFWLSKGCRLLHRQFDDKEDEPAMLVAARFGHVKTIDFLIEKGCSFFDKNRYGATCLHQATYYKQTKTVQHLLKKEPKLLRELNRYSEDAAITALISGDLTIAYLLILTEAEGALKKADNILYEISQHIKNKLSKTKHEPTIMRFGQAEFHAEQFKDVYNICARILQPAVECLFVHGFSSTKKFQDLANIFTLLPFETRLHIVSYAFFMQLNSKLPTLNTQFISENLIEKMILALLNPYEIICHRSSIYKPPHLRQQENKNPQPGQFNENNSATNKTVATKYIPPQKRH